RRRRSRVAPARCPPALGHRPLHGRVHLCRGRTTSSSGGARDMKSLGEVAALTALAAAALVSCATSGSRWMRQPLIPQEDGSDTLVREQLTESPASAPVRARTSLRIGPPPPKPEWVLEETQQGPWEVMTPQRPTPSVPDGRLLGLFRNTYYDFPNEADYEGEPVPLKDASCNTIREVPLGFHDAVCVQGSGTLTSGETVSFAKRDCPCARVCPRTDQRICFDLLARQQFPWGRGAMGKPIIPLLTV